MLGIKIIQIYQKVYGLVMEFQINSHLKLLQIQEFFVKNYSQNLDLLLKKEKLVS